MDEIEAVAGPGSFPSVEQASNGVNAPIRLAVSSRNVSFVGLLAARVALSEPDWWSMLRGPWLYFARRACGAGMCTQS